MNAIAPAGAFDLTAADRFDTHVARAFASTTVARHVRDRLIERVHAGELDYLLLRARDGMAGVSGDTERRAALNVIDFAFEALVLPNLSVAQAASYLAAVENTHRLEEASGLDGPGPLWVDTVHHACVFSVLFQMAVSILRHRGLDRAVLLHQGQRPEPRLDLVGNLLRRLHGREFVRVPLHGQWFRELARVATPKTAVFYMTDMPPAALGRTAEPRRGLSRLVLHDGPGFSFPVETLSGSATFARRLGATHLVLDYPEPGRIRVRPHDAATVTRCPIQDWIFWPLLGAGTRSPVPANLSHAPA